MPIVRYFGAFVALFFSHAYANYLMDNFGHFHCSHEMFKSTLQDRNSTKNGIQGMVTGFGKENNSSSTIKTDEQFLTFLMFEPDQVMAATDGVACDPQTYQHPVWLLPQHSFSLGIIVARYTMTYGNGKSTGTSKIYLGPRPSPSSPRPTPIGKPPPPRPSPIGRNLQGQCTCGPVFVCPPPVGKVSRFRPITSKTPKHKKPPPPILVSRVLPNMDLDPGKPPFTKPKPKPRPRPRPNAPRRNPDSQTNNEPRLTAISTKTKPKPKPTPPPPRPFGRVFPIMRADEFGVLASPPPRPPRPTAPKPRPMTPRPRPTRPIPPGFCPLAIPRPKANPPPPPKPKPKPAPRPPGKPKFLSPELNR